MVAFWLQSLHLWKQSFHSCKWKQNCESTQIGKIMQPFSIRWVSSIPPPNPMRFPRMYVHKSHDTESFIIGLNLSSLPLSDVLGASLRTVFFFLTLSRRVYSLWWLRGLLLLFPKQQSPSHYCGGKIIYKEISQSGKNGSKHLSCYLEPPGDGHVWRAFAPSTAHVLLI